MLEFSITARKLSEEKLCWTYVVRDGKVVLQIKDEVVKIAGDTGTLIASGSAI